MKKTPDASLITNRTNIAYLSNFTGSSGFMLLTKNKSYLFTDSRYIVRAASTIKKGIQIINITKVWKNPKELKKNWQKILKKHNVKILGIEENNLTITQFKKFKKISQGKLKFTNISGNLEEKREIKSKEEIAFIEKSQRINEKVFTEIEHMIKQEVSRLPALGGQAKTPLTEKNIAWKIKELGQKFGADDVSFDPIVAFGKHTAIPHHNSDNTPL
ncbi:MAG: aminopeptidase P family N-terminal domain-containing protein, partial [Patescibacteria group bacterium]